MSDCWLSKYCNQIDCDKFCIRKYKTNYLFDEAYISIKQRIPITLYPETKEDEEEYTKLSKLSSNIIDFVQGGCNLYLHSKNCGNGKTSWALRFAQKYIDKIWATSSLKCRVLFINVPRFLIALKDNISNKSDYVEHIKENVLNCDLVIWDEIGTKGLTEFEHENILNIINARLDSGKSNIYTSNLDDVALQESVGDRLYSRIKYYSIDIEFKDGDKRGISV